MGAIPPKGSGNPERSRVLLNPPQGVRIAASGTSGLAAVKAKISGKLNRRAAQIADHRQATAEEQAFAMG